MPLKSGFKDFEDAVQYYSGECCGVKGLVTRNTMNGYKPSTRTSGWFNCLSYSRCYMTGKVYDFRAYQFNIIIIVYLNDFGMQTAIKTDCG